MSKKSSTFANDYEEPTALATYPEKGIPVLTGEAAERFIKIAEENERKAKERENRPVTKEEAKKIIGFKKVMLAHEKNNIEKLEKEIKKLEEIINSHN